MKKYYYAPILAICLFFNHSAYADTIGLWVGGGKWDWDVSGSFRYQSTNFNDTINIENTGSNYLNWADDDSSTFYAIIEHPIPVLPNIKLFSTSLETRGTGQASVTFGTASLSADVTSSLKLDMTDVTLYWQILDNVVSLDLGLNVKLIDGSITVTDVSSPTQTDTANFDAPIPMLYAGVEIALPLTGLTLGANASYVGYDGNTLNEYHAYVRYNSPFVLGLEAGVKSFTLELDDLDNSYGKLEFSGVYAQLFIHF